MPKDRLTVGAFLDRWLSVNIPGTIAESTEDDYNDTVRLHLRAALGNKRLTRLTVQQARALLAAAAGDRIEVAVMIALAYDMRRGRGRLGLHWYAGARCSRSRS